MRKFRRGLRRFMHRFLVFGSYDINVLPMFAIAVVTPLTRAAMVYVLSGSGASAQAALTFALIVPFVGMLVNTLGGLSLIATNSHRRMQRGSADIR